MLFILNVDTKVIDDAFVGNKAQERAISTNASSITFV
jgi:hypothetical protein